MNAHLSPDDIAAAADGSLDAGRARHLAACPSCARAVDDLKEVMADLQNDAVPEPAAAFWEDFGARVRAATAPLPPPRRVQGTLWQPWAAAAAVAAAVLLVFGWSTMQDWRRSHEAAPLSTVDGPPAADPSWEVMADVAETMTADDVRRATAADAVGVIGELSAGERQAFVELLKLEMGDRQ